MKEKEQQIKKQQKDKIYQQTPQPTVQPVAQPVAQPVYNPPVQPVYNKPAQTTKPTTENYSFDLFNQKIVPDKQPFFNSTSSNSRDIPEIRAPDNVKDILNRIKNIQEQGNINSINTSETQDESTSNNDRLLSDTTLSSNTRKKRAAKKGGININL